MTSKQRYTNFLAWMLLACVTTLPAAETMQVEDAWAWETPPGVTTGAAYVTVINRGTADDRLIAARAPASERVELHTHEMEGDVVGMRRVESIALKAGDRTTLAPGKAHLMLIGLKQPLVAGKRFPLTLEFEKGGTMTVQVEVRRPIE